MEGERLGGGARPVSDIPEGNPRRAILFFTYLGTLMAAVLMLDAALLFPRHSVAYEWMNRIGMFVAIIIVAGLSVALELVSTRPMRTAHARFLRWYMRIGGILLPILFVLKAWNRILQAFWLR